MGTPEFAVPCLETLVDEGYQIVGVVCQPDKPKGRRLKVSMPPVKEAALRLGIDNIIQPAKIDRSFIMDVFELRPDLIVTCAYGKILPKVLLEIPEYGCINVHASLLPKYRGAGPIQWCIINGERETGVTTMFTDEGLDTGDMLLKKSVEIPEDMDAGQLHDALMHVGAELLIDTLECLQEGSLVKTPQREEESTYAPMLTKEDGKIQWSKSSNEIHNLVRGTSPWPGAFAFLNGERVKISKTRISSLENGDPGTVLRADKHGLVVACGAGSIEILELQPESGKRMDAKSFINGRRLTGGEKFDD